MDTTPKYTRADLVSFGNYLLSEKRYNLFEGNPLFTPETLEMRLSCVHDADIANWQEEKNTDAPPRNEQLRVCDCGTEHTNGENQCPYETGLGATDAPCNCCPGCHNECMDRL